jgi:uncharacterized membrane protein
MCILGGEVIWQETSRRARSLFYRLKAKRERALSTAKNGDSSTYLITLTLAILIPYFLFASGFIYEIGGSEAYYVNDTPYSIALSSYRVDMPVFNSKEAEAAQWAAANLGRDATIYGDLFGRLLLVDHLGYRAGVIPTSGEVPENAWILLRTWNIQKQEIWMGSMHLSLSDIPALLEDRQIIYNNGGAQILAPR